ncbi:hypothetical protein SCHPADRAFT_944316 [Schizopora paradoxa]|uniref:Uncharacterized protein n=1 Tax=Schizopora paradoxa TaxID=27342 RepID=A0A0H2R9S6_9AGAM|nr:hypothetical protein SCHPADRAFT_944316 [Schizopora paradoxa]
MSSRVHHDAQLGGVWDSALPVFLSYKADRCRIVIALVALHLQLIMYDDPHLALSRSSSISTNATASNLPGPGRTLDLLLQWLGKGLESFLNKRAIKLNLGPEAVARDIRRIIGIEEINAFSLYASQRAPLTKAQEKCLRKLCTRLLKYARSHVQLTQLKALDEIIELAVEDRAVRCTMRHCSTGHLVPKYEEQELYVAISRVKISLENSETHEMWSLFRARVDYIYSNWTSYLFHKEMVALVVALRNSLRNPVSSFLAARYFTRMAENFKPTIAMCYFEVLLKTYTDLLSAPQDNIGFEWSSLNRCGSIVHLLDSEFYRSEFPGILFGQRARLQMLIQNTFATDKVFYRTNDTETKWGELFTFIGHYPAEDQKIYNLEGNFITTPRYNLRRFRDFLSALTGLGPRDYKEMLNFLQAQDTPTQEGLKDIFIGDKKLIVYLRIVLHMEENLGMPCISCRCFDLQNEQIPRSNCVFPNCPMHAVSLLNSYCNIGTIKDRAHALFLMSVIYSSNRYYKLALCQASEHPICISRLSLKNAMDFTPIVNYGHDGCLWRICIKSRYQFIYKGDFILESGPSQNLKFSEDDCHITSTHGDVDQIHTMCITYGTVMLFPHIKTEDLFDATGHYPIIAYREKESEEPYFLAIVTQEDGRNIFATVKDGDLTATYHDKFGKAHVAQGFYVLVLRHDPIDFLTRPGESRWEQSRPHMGSLDPTGPIHWLQYYPDMDPDFFDVEDEFIPDEVRERFAPKNGDFRSRAKPRNEIFSNAYKDRSLLFSYVLGPVRDFTESHDGAGVHYSRDSLDNVDNTVKVFDRAGTLQKTGLEAASDGLPVLDVIDKPNFKSKCGRSEIKEEGVEEGFETAEPTFEEQSLIGEETRKTRVEQVLVDEMQGPESKTRALRDGSWVLDDEKIVLNDMIFEKMDEITRLLSMASRKGDEQDI